ncbi:MAG: hypothetical protein K2H82_07900 [Oscillospiraceae bacterium]|nr:hypothetical protein [Oscillospiraceae bacterium]
MNDLTIWNYKNSEIRTIEKDNETWWVLKDICNALEISNNRRVAERLDTDELMSLKVTSGGQQREILCINEFGLYTIILRSNKPQAKPFRRWVTHEVLPQIRKTGSYSIPTPALTVKDYIHNTCKELGMNEPIMSADLVRSSDVPDDYYLVKAWDALHLTYGFAPDSKEIVIDNIIQKKTVLYLYFHVGRQSHYFEAKFKKRGKRWWLFDFNHSRTKK